MARRAGTAAQYLPGHGLSALCLSHRGNCMSDGTRQAGDKGDLASLLAGYPVVVVQAVIWGDMDSYRHVNNTVYFRYFENARLEYFRRMRWFEYEEESGIGPILSATDCRFRKPLTYPDTISIGAKIGSMA